MECRCLIVELDGDLLADVAGDVEGHEEAVVPLELAFGKGDFDLVVLVLLHLVELVEVDDLFRGLTEGAECGDDHGGLIGAGAVGGNGDLLDPAGVEGKAALCMLDALGTVNGAHSHGCGGAIDGESDVHVVENGVNSVAFAGEGSGVVVVDGIDHGGVLLLGTDTLDGDVGGGEGNADGLAGKTIGDAELQLVASDFFQNVTHRTIKVIG